MCVKAFLPIRPFHFNAVHINMGLRLTWSEDSTDYLQFCASVAHRISRCSSFTNIERGKEDHIIAFCLKIQPCSMSKMQHQYTGALFVLLGDISILIPCKFFILLFYCVIFIKPCATEVLFSHQEVSSYVTRSNSPICKDNNFGAVISILGQYLLAQLNQLFPTAIKLRILAQKPTHIVPGCDIEILWFYCKALYRRVDSTLALFVEFTLFIGHSNLFSMHYELYTLHIFFILVFATSKVKIILAFCINVLPDLPALLWLQEVSQKYISTTLFLKISPVV
mmetsp:Transcript_21442/g.36832  ORF Transcript_21442/g.36832 Transcript_21442/m.36832 type:complete len:280 (+) Transcript_21442:151-990(+)